jgi:hypothetical protein
MADATLAAPTGLLTRLKGRDDGATALALLVALIAAAAFFAMQPRLGILDADGYAYAMGARDIRAGLGYRGLMGDPFNHWPPGYSLILSLFADPVGAAWVINGLSFGATLGLLYLLARRHDWTWAAALGLSAGLGAGFFRIVASDVHADILTYAVFLGGLILATARPARTLPAIAWSVLIPIKFIAVAFLPPAVLADFVAAPKDVWGLVRRYLPGGLIAIAITAAVLVYNQVTIGTWMSASHASSSLRDLIAGAKGFVISIPREFLFGWYGSLAGLLPKLFFGASMVLLAICALSLKPSANGRWLRWYGAGFLVCCVVLLCVRSFDPSVRLSAYGLVALLVGMRPLRWANWAWLLYGLVALAAAGVDAATTNDLGANDPRYAQLASQVGAYDKDRDVVASNAYHLLDLHAGIPSAPVSDYADAAPYKLFFWVTLPSYDAVATTVAPMPAPPAGWCKVRQFEGGALYQRCA